MFQALGEVDTKHVNCSPADRRAADQLGTAPDKVLSPEGRGGDGVAASGRRCGSGQDSHGYPARVLAVSRSTVGE
jgi:hypothetical protein